MNIVKILKLYYLIMDSVNWNVITDGYNTEKFPEKYVKDNIRS